jgi:hypothetical protein
MTKRGAFEEGPPPLLPQSDNVYLHEIATTLGCHKAFILETITTLQKDLKEARACIQEIQRLTQHRGA